MSRISLPVVLASAAVLACGREERTGPVQVSLAAINAKLASAGATSLGGPAASVASALADRQLDPASWRASSILSGPPDELRVRLVEIEGVKADGSAARAWSSPAPRGTEIVLTNGTVDLGGTLGAALALPVGDYRGLRLRLGRVGRMKGCVSGQFRWVSPQVTVQILAGSMLGGYEPRHVGNTYTNDPIAEDGVVHTFCTQAARSQLSAEAFSTDAIGSNADFEASATPELAEVDLNGGIDPGGSTSAAALRAATIDLQSDVAFGVAEDAATRVTLAIDLNRQLRYFANTRGDFNPPNPGMKTGTSYFFTTIFRWSAVGIAGDGASVEGYQVDVEDGSLIVKEWLTVFRDAGGQPIAGLVIPDDDNDHTIAKGTLDPAASAAAGDAWDLVFRLGPEGASVSTLRGFAFTAPDGTGSCTLDPLQDLPDMNVFYAREL
jgi:hypothetical protein